MIQVPFFRPELTDAELAEVADTLRSGWLTTGPKVRRFEEAFAEAVGAPHAIALGSCTAALHLATVALGLREGQIVLVPTMTFAATAEVIRYAGALPLLVDCDPHTLHMDLDDARRKLDDLRNGRLPPPFDPEGPVVGMAPVHVGGVMMDADALAAFAFEHALWTVEDAAHSFPAAFRPSPQAPWRRCGEGTAEVSCFSFYANKTITTGEGGMATTAEAELADEIRSLSLHGLSHDAWGRYSGQGAWDYRILAPGYKYNLTDVAAALGLHQLARAEELRQARARIAGRYLEAFADLEELELPPAAPDRVHAWHLFQVKLRGIAREPVLAVLRREGVGFSVHWRPLHLHPYYEESFGWLPEHLPVASAVWPRTISLPLFPAMREDEVERVIAVVRQAVREAATTPATSSAASR